MWLVFTLITTAFWSIAELFYKKGARQHEKYSHLKIVIFVGLAMGIHALIVLLTQDINFDPVNLLKYLPVSLCYIVSMACSYFGVRFIEESISDPIENTSGALCALMCLVFLHQKIDGISFIAIGIMVVGIIGVGYLENKGDTDRKKKIGKTIAIVAFTMPFLYAIIDALGSFLDIYYLDLETTRLVNVTEETIENVANTCYELTFLFIAIVMIVFLLIKKVKLFETEEGSVKEDGTKLPWYLRVYSQKDKMIAAICETAGQFTYVFAMSDNGAIAAPIISSVCVFSLLLSRIFLKEKLTKWQYFFIALVLAGIVMLAIIQGDA